MINFGDNSGYGDGTIRKGLLNNILDDNGYPTTTNTNTNIESLFSGKRLIIYSPVIIMMLQVTMSIVVLKITLTLEMILIILRFMMQLEHQVTTV